MSTPVRPCTAIVDAFVAREAHASLRLRGERLERPFAYLYETGSISLQLVPGTSWARVACWRGLALRGVDARSGHGRPDRASVSRNQAHPHLNGGALPHHAHRG
jgi:hypothetical protein